MTAYEVLLIDDDDESLDLLVQTLPSELDGHAIVWTPCNTFDEALDLLRRWRFDLVATDIYRDSSGVQKTPATSEPRVFDVIEAIRSIRFTPIVAFTDGAFPEELEEGPFLKTADKSGGNEAILSRLSALIATGVPTIARELHDQLDRVGGSYIWDFLEENWSALSAAGLTEEHTLDRLIRRRTSIELGRRQPQGGSEVAVVEGAEFYLYPPLSSDIRLGTILIRQSDGEYGAVLTPHCHLIQQPGADAPRAEYVLVARTIEASILFDDHPLKGDEANRKDGLRRRLLSPPQLGRPSGRYWFLPNFLMMSDRYVDFVQLDSVPYKEIGNTYEVFAVLDAPFAEAMQSCFVGFYSAVGLPNLDAERFSSLNQKTD